MLNDILKELEGMSDADKQAILNTQYPAELEKAASASIDGEQLAEALYSYGWLAAERAVAEADGIDKIAAEDLEAHNAAVNEAGETIEALLSDLGTADLEDEAELHKEAQAAAGLMFDGYASFLDSLAMEKGAAAMGAIKGALKGLKGQVGKAVEGAKKHKAVKLMRKHPGKAAALAGGVAAGSYVAKKHMQKKASEATVEEMALAVAEIQSEQSEVTAEIESGFDKLAAHGANKAAEFLKKHLGKAKAMAGKGAAHVKKHKGLYGLGVGAAAGAGAAHAAHKAK